MPNPFAVLEMPSSNDSSEDESSVGEQSAASYTSTRAAPTSTGVVVRKSLRPYLTAKKHSDSSASRVHSYAQALDPERPSLPASSARALASHDGPANQTLPKYSDEVSRGEQITSAPVSTAGSTRGTQIKRIRAPGDHEDVLVKLTKNHDLLTEIDKELAAARQTVNECWVKMATSETINSEIRKSLNGARSTYATKWPDRKRIASDIKDLSAVARRSETLARALS